MNLYNGQVLPRTFSPSASFCSSPTPTAGGPAPLPFPPLSLTVRPRTLLSTGAGWSRSSYPLFFIFFLPLIYNLEGGDVGLVGLSNHYQVQVRRTWVEAQDEAQVHPAFRISFQILIKCLSSNISCFSFVLAGLVSLSPSQLIAALGPSQAQPFIFFNEDY